MKTEDICKPLGIDTERPAFSWKIASEKDAVMQKSFCITVRNSDKTVWNSGEIYSGDSLYIEYSGEQLSARTRYFWSVRVTTEDGDKCESDEEWFETGLMSSDMSAWSGAKWIGSPYDGINTGAVYDYAISCIFSGERICPVINSRDKNNYILLDINFREKYVRISDVSDDCVEKQTKNICEYEYVPRILAEHEVNIKMNHGCITLLIDGYKLMDNQETVPPFSQNKPPKGCMMFVGFNQPSEKAVVKHLKIETMDNTLQEDDFKNGIFSSLGREENGSLILENVFETICPSPSVNLRRFFEVKGEAVSARLYIAARGFYMAYVNGVPVGEDYYNPGFTDYRIRIQYQTFDITDMLLNGVNTISATLGKSHYSGTCGYSGSMIYGEENSLISKVVITYSDGAESVIVTDKDWQFTDKGPICDSDYFNGETYDARLEFDVCDIRDKRWEKCGIKPAPKKPKATNGEISNAAFMLSAQRGERAQAVEILKAKSIEKNKNRLMYDMGQNMVGTVRIIFKGKRGEAFKIRYGEMIRRSGELYTENLRSAANTDIYIPKGSETEEFIPMFTEHGFRYVEISGCGFDAVNDNVISVEGIAVSNVHTVTGGFECSNSLINRLQSNIMWGQWGNMLLVPTDCPQRNERMGWTGDVQVFAETGAYNMDIKTFMDKWLLDLRDAQLMYNRNGAVPDTAPLGGDNREDGCGGWGDAAVIVPFEMYRAYGDKRILEECYEMMRGWVEYQSRSDRQNCGERENLSFSDISSKPYIQCNQRRGDHLAVDASTPFILSATAYAAHSAQLLSKAASILGKNEDAEKYRIRFENIKEAFNEAWTDSSGAISYWGEDNGSKAADGSVPRGNRYSDKEGAEHHPSQTAYALCIDFELADEDKLKGMSEYLRRSVERNDNKLSVGFLGISHIASALSKTGNYDTAFKLLMQEDNPSWLYSVKNGATTIWERWDSYIAEEDKFGDVSMNSFNHYAYGAIGAWMFSDILGIKPIEAGYKTFALNPHWGGNLTYAKGFHISPYGEIKSSWKIENDSVIYKCTVPPNTTAILTLCGEEYTLKSGSYDFVKKIQIKALL